VRLRPLSWWNLVLWMLYQMGNIRLVSAKPWVRITARRAL